jgi:hypothetical protein
MAVNEVAFLAVADAEHDLVADDDIPANYDLTGVSEGDLSVLKTCVTEYNSAARRVVSELVVMTEQLATIQKIIPRRRDFYAFARNELGVGKRTITRYLHLHKVLQQHFAVDGKVPAQIGSAFSQRALLLLSPDTDESVILELKSVIDEGGKVETKDVESLLAKRDAEHRAQLASAQADLQAVSRELGRTRDQAAIELARTQRELSAQTELLRRAESNGRVLEEENTTLRRQATEVRYETKHVEIIPAGYASVQEAIEKKEGELSELTTRQHSAAENVAALEAQKAALEEKLANFRAGIDEFLAMKDSVEALIGKFPMGMVKEMGAGDKTVKAAMTSLGRTMILFGEQLNSAGA